MDLDTRIGESLRTDYFLLREEFTPAQLDYLTRTRTFVEQDVLPVINGYWERAEFPWPLIEKMAAAGIVGDGIVGYGCPEIDPLSAGLITMELSRGDGSLATFLGVQAGLAMRSIAMLGSEEQKQRWLPPMARLEKLGAFALTEPDHGSDSIALESTARRDGDSYVLNGHKKWIGNGSIADVVVVWARDTARRAGQGLPGGEGHAGLPGPGDRGQGLAARGLAGRDRARRAARPGREQAARRRVVPQHRAPCWPAPGSAARGPRSGTRSPATTPR